MRVPFGRDIFDYVFNFFTSFGHAEARLIPEELKEASSSSVNAALA
jgi:hypothetical protein